MHEEGWRIRGNSTFPLPIEEKLHLVKLARQVRNSNLAGRKKILFFITTLGVKKFDTHPIFRIPEYGVSGPEDMKLPIHINHK